MKKNKMQIYHLCILEINLNSLQKLKSYLFHLNAYVKIVFNPLSLYIDKISNILYKETKYIRGN